MSGWPDWAPYMTTPRPPIEAPVDVDGLVPYGDPRWASAPWWAQGHRNHCTGDPWCHRQVHQPGCEVALGRDGRPDWSRVDTSLPRLPLLPRPDWHRPLTPDLTPAQESAAEDAQDDRRGRYNGAWPRA